MAALLILIGAVLLVSAVRNTEGDLGNALVQDVPGFLKWALAIVAVGALGWVPGMRTISRWLLALVLLVIVLKNYTKLFQGFTSLETPPAPSQAAASPASAYVANPAAPNITQAEITGTSNTVPGSINAAGIAPTVTNPQGAFSPQAFLAAYEAGTIGFGGVA
jgi:flagellar biosynthesis component FlhA